MVFFLLVLFLLTLYRAEFSKPGSFNDRYLSKDNTTAINGIFVILVVFSHYEQYADFSGTLDLPYMMLKEHLKQMVVSTFLFFSGFGMMEAVKKKGDSYIDSMWGKFWKLLFRYDVAVCLYLLVGAVLGIKHEMKNILLAFTTWTSVGNSNWYITIVLILYILIFVAFKIGRIVGGKYENLVSIHLLILLGLISVYVLMKMEMPTRYYNTLILLPLGFLYSYWKDSIDGFVMRNEIYYLIVAGLVLIAYVISYKKRWDYGIESYTVWAVFFIAVILVIAMKVKLKSPVLHWFGEHVFSIYILQRLPMMVLDRLGYIQSHKYLCLIIVFCTTIPISIMYEKFTDALISKIGNEKTVPKKQ